MRDRRLGRDGRRPIWRTALVVVFWLAVWQLAACAVGSPLLLAGPAATLERLCLALAQGSLWASAGFSAVRIVGGLAASFALAVALSAAAARWAPVRELVSVPMLLFKSVPVVCIVVLLLLWTDPAGVPFLCVAFVVLPAVYFSALEGLDNLDARREDLLRVFGVGGLRRALVSAWPQVLPFVTGAARTVVGMAWKAGVAAELIGIPDGSIGERIYQSKLLLETADLFAWTAAVIALSWLCEKVALALLEASGPAARRLGMAGAFARDGGGLAPGAAAPGTPAEAVRLEGVRARYGDGPDVLGSFSLDVPAGGRTCLYAPSGAGKTTVLRIALGLMSAASGRVAAPSRSSCVLQDPCLVEELSAEQNVALASAGLYAEDEVRALLGAVLPQEALGRPVSGLSGGQRRRVELVRALAHPGGAVVLDEPFSGLDERSHEDAAAFVLERLGGRTLLVATHDERDADLLGAAACRMQPAAPTDGEGGAR